MTAGRDALPAFDGLRARHWHTQLRPDGVLVLSFDREGASVNTLSQDVLIELDALLERLALDPPKALVVRSGKDKGFVAGADIKEFQAFDRKGTVGDAIRRGQQVFQRLAELPFPTVAAIHGFCMGGGTEIALACRYRVASDDASTRIGLPEVKLGIFPGWGGSVRLPRLIGAPAAFDMMLTGRSLSAKAARAIGLVDKVVSAGQLVDAAAALALKGAQRPFKQRFLGWATNTWPARQLLAPMLAKQVARKARKEHYPAPYALINSWSRAGGGVPGAAGGRTQGGGEARIDTPTARNLIRVFFLQERLKAQGGKRAWHHPRACRRRRRDGRRHRRLVGLQGLRGHAAATASSASSTRRWSARGELFDEKGEGRRQAAAGGRAPEGRPRRRRRGQGRPGDRGDHREGPRPSATCTRRSSRAMKADALLTTNTSSIPLTELRGHLRRPAQFAGLHYFNPVALMPLVEIIRHDAHGAGDRAAPGRLLQGDRQAAGAGGGHARLPGQPRAVPLHAGGGDGVFAKASRAR